MTNIEREASERTPKIVFKFDEGKFLISGESYPEDVSQFYGPPMEALETYFDGLKDTEVTFTFAFVYFNSSTAKIVMGLFDLLDSAAETGNSVKVVWEYEEDDDNMEELGEEFGEDLEHATFVKNVVAI